MALRVFVKPYLPVALIGHRRCLLRYVNGIGQGGASCPFRVVFGKIAEFDYPDAYVAVCRTHAPSRLTLHLMIVSLFISG